MRTCRPVASERNPNSNTNFSAMVCCSRWKSSWKMNEDEVFNRTVCFPLLALYHYATRYVQNQDSQCFHFEIKTHETPMNCPCWKTSKVALWSLCINSSSPLRIDALRVDFFDVKMWIWNQRPGCCFCKHHSMNLLGMITSFFQSHRDQAVGFSISGIFVFPTGLSQTNPREWRGWIEAWQWKVMPQKGWWSVWKENGGCSGNCVNQFLCFSPDFLPFWY